MTPPERSALKRGYHECKIAKLQDSKRHLHVCSGKLRRGLPMNPQLPLLVRLPG